MTVVPTQGWCILRTCVAVTDYSKAAQLIVQWGEARESRYVCAANVHMVMEAYDDAMFSAVVNDADLVTPDGMPLVWMLKRLGAGEATRVYGPDLMLAVCERAEAEGVAVGLYGGQLDSAQTLRMFLMQRFSQLKIAYQDTPPFRSLSEEEDQRVIRSVNQSGIGILFVALGCPKQECWMAQHKGQINAVMLGVGAAFDFYSGYVKQAPYWMQRMGLEWFYRLSQEPKRLWKRYTLHNSRFIVLALWQLIKYKIASLRAHF